MTLPPSKAEARERMLVAMRSRLSVGPRYEIRGTEEALDAILATLPPQHSSGDVRERLREQIARHRHPEIWADYDKACACPSVTQPATLKRDRTLAEADSILSIPALASALGSQDRPAPVDEAAVERAARAAFPKEWAWIDRQRRTAKCYRETPHEQGGFESREAADERAAEYEASADRAAQRTSEIVRRALTASPPSSDGPLSQDDAECVLHDCLRDMRGPPTDDKALIDQLRARGVWLYRFQALSDQEPSHG